MAGYCDQGSNNWTMLLLTLLLSWPATVSASSAVSLASSSFLAPSEVNTCDISEFRCPSKDGQGTLCLPMDRWCNGKDECDNRVDEPRSCTICNRTYYARLGSTYRLSLVRPRMSGTTQILPWHCWFNFTALGGHHGDRVLVGMEAFSVGQLHRSENGSLCLGGQVVQRDASSTPADVDVVHGGDQVITGAWCGEGWGQPITTSAGKWLQLMLTISDIVDLSRFRFDLTYRVVRADMGNLSPSTSAITSTASGYNGGGGAAAILWYGDPVPGTLCSRNLHSCDQRTCILQSPNFPGLYPRNATCYYYIRQAWSPKNQTILLTLVQTEPGQSFSVRTSDAGEKERKMMSGRECRPWVDDTVSIYNGATIESPLLARLCGTGTMPHITGAGGELLVVFHSQPHDAPFNPAPLGASPGFRLTTRVRFVAANQVRQYHPECRISIASSGSNSRRSQRQGIIRSPDATIAPNTTCLYEFTGREDQRVWMTFLSYRLQASEDGDCLTLTDGQELVFRQCGADIQPRICPHALVHANASTAYKPCRWQDGESYLSRSPRFTIRQELATGTAIHPWSFVIRYEFITVDRFTSKQPLVGKDETRPSEWPEASSTTPGDDDDDQLLASQLMTPDCFQLLESAKGNGSISSPRNPLLYGRGGSRHLRCLYRFQAGKGEHTHLTINPFHSTGCARFNQSGCQACLSVDEVFWGGKVRRRSYHTCRSLSGNNPVVLQSAASSLELIFEVRDMNWAQDDDHFYFVAEYSFSRGIDPLCWDSHQQTGKRGNLRIDPRDRCVRHSIPWHIQAPRGGYIILVFPAGQASITKTVEGCPTNNRLFVYSITDGKTQLYREVCLMAGSSLLSSSDKAFQQPLNLYSAGWAERNWMSDGLLVVASLQGIPIADETPLIVTWLSVFKDVASKSMSFAARQSAHGNASQMVCRTGCPALGACLSSDLWCDDREDCPDGSDEQQCIRLVFWPLYVGLVVILLSLTAGLVAAFLVRRYYHSRRYTANGRPYKPRPKENTKAKFSSVTVSLTRHYEKGGPGS